LESIRFTPPKKIRTHFRWIDRARRPMSDSKRSRRQFTTEDRLAGGGGGADQVGAVDRDARGRHDLDWHRALGGEPLSVRRS
jgi:hypothetical protein